MLALGIILIIGGVVTCAVGMAQNTILYSLFADLNSQLVRANSEIEFHFSWLFIGPGTITLIIGVVITALGIVLICRYAKSRSREKDKKGKRQR